MDSHRNLAQARQLIALRQRKGLTQSEIAERMNTVQPAVARLEARLLSCTMPTFRSLEKYASALGRTLEIRFR